MPAATSSSQAAKPAGNLSYTFAPLPLMVKNHISSLPAISPQIGTISRTHRSRLPAKLATVSLVGRRDHSKTTPSVFFEEKEEETFASLEECLQSRPPLQLDLTGPKPTTYDPPASGLPWGTTSPSYTMRPKTQPEKDKGGDRVAWLKQWIASPDIWTYRANFDSRYKWPSPAHYSVRTTVGSPQFCLHQSPSHTFGKRTEFCINKKGSEDEPAPNQYSNRGKDKLMTKSPSYTIQQGRRGGAVFWMAREPVPGPGSYNPRVYCTSTKRCAPAFTLSRSPREIGITQNCTF